MLCRRWYLLRNWHYLKSNTLLNEIWPCIKHCPRTLPLPCVIMMIIWSSDQIYFQNTMDRRTSTMIFWHLSILWKFCLFFCVITQCTMEGTTQHINWQLSDHTKGLYFVVVIKHCKIRAKDNKNLSKKITKFLFTSVPFSINSTVSFSSSVICSMIQGDSLSLVPPNFSTKKKTVKHPL